MLEGWQGWWTSAKYLDGINNFAWTPTNKIIPEEHPSWGFKKVPHDGTCVWILQISVYNYTWGNYDCSTVSGYICEIDLPRLGNRKWLDIYWVWLIFLCDIVVSMRCRKMGNYRENVIFLKKGLDVAGCMMVDNMLIGWMSKWVSESINLSVIDWMADWLTEWLISWVSEWVSEWVRQSAS